MGAGLIVIERIQGQNPAQMLLAKDQDVIQAVALSQCPRQVRFPSDSDVTADIPDRPFRATCGIRRPHQATALWAILATSRKPQSNTIFVPDEPLNEIVENCTVPKSATGGERAGTIHSGSWMERS